MLSALAPPLGWDALCYHLSLPKIYRLDQKILYLPFTIFWGMPQTGEMIFTLAMAIGGVQAATISAWMAGLFVLIGLFGFLNERFSPGVGWTSIAVLLCSETIALEFGLGYVDLLTMLFGLALFITLERWANTDRSPATLALAGCFAGFGFASKYTAGILLICGAVAILAVDRKNFLQALFRAGIFAALAAAPRLIKNILAMNCTLTSAQSGIGLPAISQAGINKI